MSYFLYLIGVVAILLAILLLFNRSDLAVSAMTPAAIAACLMTGIVMCALGRIIGLLKQIARNTAREQIASQF